MWCANDAPALKINNAIDTKASRHSYGIDLLHVCLHVEEATEFDVLCVPRRKALLQVCADEIAVAVEMRSVNFR